MGSVTPEPHHHEDCPLCMRGEFCWHAPTKTDIEQGYKITRIWMRHFDKHPHTPGATMAMGVIFQLVKYIIYLESQQVHQAKEPKKVGLWSKLINLMVDR